MKKIAILAILMLLLAAPCLSLSTEEAIRVLETPASAERYFEEIKTQFNTNLDQVPGFIKMIIGDEKINFYITNSETHKFNAVMENAKIESLDNEHLEDPTLNVYVEKEVIPKLISGELNIKEALGNGEVRYEAATVWNKIVYGFAGLFI
jgi:hypothetical protein